MVYGQMSNVAYGPSCSNHVGVEDSLAVSSHLKSIEP